LIDIAWRHFRTGERSALDEPVPHEAAYYSAAAQVVKLPMRQR
jgi:hypothetical protein